MDITKETEIKEEIKDINKIHKLYENLTYFSEYGFSVIVFILITIIIFYGCAFFQLMINAQSIRDDWPNQRCNPKVMPFAGFINKPDNMTIMEYTQQNYQYCMQNTLQAGASEALSPLTFVTSMLSTITADIQDAIQDIRTMISNVRTNIEDVAKELMGRLMNMMIPLQQIIIAFNDIMSKIQGIATATLYTSMGSYYTLQSLMGAITQLIIDILIALSLTIVGLWVVPVTWPMAASLTAIFVAVSVPLALIVSFMTDVMHITPDGVIPAVPQAPSCFDADTYVEMNNGALKPISKINVGDVLKNENQVTAIMKLIPSNKSAMYELNGIIVSDSHIVFDDILKKWVYVPQHYKSKKMDFFDGHYLYCLNTTTKEININDIRFTDWDEIVNEKDKQIFKNLIYESDKYELFQKNEDYIHRYFEGGFSGETPILLNHGQCKLKDVKIGDVFEDGAKVTGLVEINGSNLEEQYIYTSLEKNKKETIVFEGGPNLIIYSKNKYNCYNYFSTFELNEYYKIKIDLDNFLDTVLFKKEKRAIKEAKLYHLITDKTYFNIHHVRVGDYSACYDYFLKTGK